MVSAETILEQIRAWLRDGKTLCATDPNGPLLQISPDKSTYHAGLTIAGTRQPSGIERAVCEDITRRQQLGIAKYGQTVADNPLPLKQWLQHAYEESLDFPVYLKRAIAEIDSKTRLIDDENGEHVRYMTATPGALPIRPGEPGYDEAPYEVMLMWKRK